MASTYITRTPSSNGNQKTWTWSGWLKLDGGISGSTYQYFMKCLYGDQYRYTLLTYRNSKIELYGGDYQTSNSQMSFDLTTTRVLRDPNCWYHIVVAMDTTQSTAADRCKLYINGVQETSFTSYDGSSSSTYPAQNDITFMNVTTTSNVIGKNFNGSMSHVHFCDGQQLAPTVFGETDSTTGEWKIKTNPTFTPGTNGFSIFKDGMTITDQSANSNDFTLSQGTLTKTEDSPSNVFATLNPLLTHAAHGYSLTYGLGNNKITFNEPSTWTYTTSTIAGINGKFYAEFKIDAVGSESSIGVIASDTVNNNQTSGGLDDYLGKETDSIGYLNDGRTFKNNSAQQTGLTAISAGNILGVALDTENNTCQFYINGSSSGNPVSLTADKFYHFGVSGYNGTQISCNFGNGYFGTTAVSSAGTNASNIGIFEYNVPTGFTALSTKGLNL